MILIFMLLPFCDLLDILKVLSSERPKSLNPITVTAWIQERSDIPLSDLHEQYKTGKKELTEKILALGYSGDTQKLHLNDLWRLLAEIESNAD